MYKYLCMDIKINTKHYVNLMFSALLFCLRKIRYFLNMWSTIFKKVVYHYDMVYCKFAIIPKLVLLATWTFENRSKVFCIYRFIPSLVLIKSYCVINKKYILKIYVAYIVYYLIFSIQIWIIMISNHSIILYNISFLM